MAQRTSTPGTTGDYRPSWPAQARHVLPGKPAFKGQRLTFASALALRLAGAGLLGWIGYIHWHLWQEGYKYIPTNGPLFLLDAIVAVALGLVLLTWPRPLAGLAGAAFTAATILALVISLSVGLFGFHESISASYVVQSLVLESAAVIILLSWTAVTAAAVIRNHRC
jgi:membrane-bound ClpP family serine protease